MNIISTILSLTLYYMYNSPTQLWCIQWLGFLILALTNSNFDLSPWPKEFSFFAYRKLTLNYAKAFVMLYPQPLYLLEFFLDWNQTYWKSKPTYSCSTFQTNFIENQQQKFDISHFALIYKSCLHVQIVPIRFVSHVSMTKQFMHKKLKNPVVSFSYNMHLKMCIKNM